MLNILDYQTYTNTASIMNKDTLYANSRQSFVVVDEVQNNKNNDDSVDAIKERQKLEKEQVAALYFNHEATQAMKSRMNTLLDTPSEDEKGEALSFQELLEIQQKRNRYEIMQNYEPSTEEEVRIWA